MLDGNTALSDEANVENNNPVSLITSGDGVSNSNGVKPKQLLLKKGGRKLRTNAAVALHQHKSTRSSAGCRLSDHNNTAMAAAVHRGHHGTEHTAGTVLTLHHLKQGAKKELLKSKGGRFERGAAQQGSQPARSVLRHDQTTQNVNARGHKAKQSQTSGAPHSVKKDKSSQKREKKESLQTEALC
ncbi:proline-rich nuclear receptor coactivator 1 isoform 2-T2 [Pholidichthys leucotaenia]